MNFISGAFSFVSQPKLVSFLCICVIWLLVFIMPGFKHWASRQFSVRILFYNSHTKQQSSSFCVLFCMGKHSVNVHVQVTIFILVPCLRIDTLHNVIESKSQAQFGTSYSNYLAAGWIIASMPMPQLSMAWRSFYSYGTTMELAFFMYHVHDHNVKPYVLNPTCTELSLRVDFYMTVIKNISTHTSSRVSYFH